VTAGARVDQEGPSLRAQQTGAEVPTGVRGRSAERFVRSSNDEGLRLRDGIGAGTRRTGKLDMRKGIEERERSSNGFLLSSFC
jgi:hypothetical protein